MSSHRNYRDIQRHRLERLPHHVELLPDSIDRWAGKFNQLDQLARQLSAGHDFATAEIAERFRTSADGLMRETYRERPELRRNPFAGLKSSPGYNVDRS